MTRVLVELRPAFEGRSGIPQETRLLFAGLARAPGIDACGLLQRGGGILAQGLPASAEGRVEPVPGELRSRLLEELVRTLGPRPPSQPLATLLRKARSLVVPALAVLSSAAGRRIRLGFFDPKGFEDAVWTTMFAPTLSQADRASVVAACYRVLRWPWSTLHAIGVASSWLGRAIYPKLDTSGVDVVIGETPFPARVKPPTKLVVRYHDAFPLVMTSTVKNRGYHRATHRQALHRNARDGAWFACVSETTRRDLLAEAPEIGERVVTIPNMVSDDYHEETRPIGDVAAVIAARRNVQAPSGGGRELATDVCAAPSFLLAVGTLEPRKNHLGLLSAWRQLRANGFAALQLVFVGSIGWGRGAILEGIAPSLRDGGLHLLRDVPVDELRLLYRHASVTVCPSFGEGFDYPGVEAMRCGGLVAASDLPVHREVFADGCAYFDADSSDNMAAALAVLLDAGAAERRAALVAAGKRVSARYLPERVIPQWTAFLTSVAAR